MADCRCVQVLTFCVFTQIFLLCVAQNTHMQNVAENKPCDVSTTYSPYNNCSAALNGNTDTVYHENISNCIHTAVGDKSPFWWVDLGEEIIINMITIYGRTAFIDRMPCVNVSVDGVVVKRFTDVSGWTNNTYNIPVLRGGQVVSITKDCDSVGPTINICEVQVWECLDGWYGANCSQTCGKCGNSSVCDKTTGRCTSCQTEFNPPYCKECADGWYGTDCSQTCGNCISNSDCDKTTGRCTSCQTGFNLPYCTGKYLPTTGTGWRCSTEYITAADCEKGWYGHNCAEMCGHCVGGNSTCDKINGSCPSCDGAFQPPLCKDSLSSWPPMTILNTSSSVQATATQNPSFSSTAGMSYDNDKETVSVAGPVAGSAVGGAVVFFIIGAIFGWWLRKSRSQQPSNRGCTPHGIPMMSDAGTSRSSSRPDEKVDKTSDYINICYSTDVYDTLKAPDDNTTAYTSLDFYTNGHR